MAKMKRFAVTYTVTAIVEISEDVLALPETDPNGRYFRKGANARDVATHVAYNLVRNGIGLDQIDGFADRSPSEAQVTSRITWTQEELSEIK